MSSQAAHPRRGMARRREHCEAAGAAPVLSRGRQLFDHLVSSHQQCLRNRYTHRLSGLEINHQLKLGRLLDRDVGDLAAMEELDDLSGIASAKADRRGP